VSDGVALRNYGFIAGCALSKKHDPLQYHFDWGDSTTSAWQSDSIASHTWTAAGFYGLRVQARNARDTTWVSLWSAPITVTMQ
jgi:hypothetical protein